MDAIGLVRQDHRRLEALLDRCERTDHDGAGERTALLAQLDAALRQHVDEEEALLYPAFPRAEGDLLARATEQHRRITTLADELSAIAPTADSFQPKLRALADAVRDHLDIEDGLLTALEAVLDDPTLLDLGRRLENRRRVVAAQEALRTTTTNLLPRPRGGVVVAVAATAAAIALVAITRRRARGR